MSEYYLDYVWRNGIPYGISKMSQPVACCYKIAMDPYRKRIAVEQYEGAIFKRVIYDSALLDFRHLKPPAEQTAWQKVVISSSAGEVTSHIRNQDDRLICIETCLFQNQSCIQCSIFSAHGFQLSIHRMFYKSLGAAFNGVILYDVNEHAVMHKKYEVDDESGEFTILLEEQWEIDKQTTPSAP